MKYEEYRNMDYCGDAVRSGLLAGLVIKMCWNQSHVQSEIRGSARHPFFWASENWYPFRLGVRDRCERTCNGERYYSEAGQVLAADRIY